MYKLWVGQTEYEAKENEYVFFSAEFNYLLVYSENRPNDEFEEVPETLYSELSNWEKTWLQGCQMIIMTKYLKEKADDCYQSFENFLDEIIKAQREENGNG